MMIFWWILILIPVVAIVWWATASTRKPRSPSGKDDPMQVLKDRYARGEIGKEEFEEKKRTLQG